MIKPSDRIALLMHDHVLRPQGKMGFALLRYRPAPVVAIIDRSCVGGDAARLTGVAEAAGVPIVETVTDALRYDANVLVLGIATVGGVLPDGYRAEIADGLRAGMSLVNGLHEPLANDAMLRPLLHEGARIWDVRREPAGVVNGTGEAAGLACQRVLTVGTDMAIGKMTVSIECDLEARRRGLRSRFLASGQIGIVLSGDGVALDAVRVDFAPGSVQQLVLRGATDESGRANDVLFIEGQGSVCHPASTAWLALMRGSCPTHLVLVHRPGQTHIDRLDHVPIPPLGRVVEVYEAVAASAGGPPAKVVAVALNCGRLDDDAARRACAEVEREVGLPTTDVLRFGAGPILDALGLPGGTATR